MKMSIVTAVRNDHRIAHAIRSVQAQETDVHEHLIIDGASDDGTLELIEKGSCSNVKVISEPDDGLYDAINKGIRNATGDIVGFLNADDWFASPYSLKRISDTFGKTKCEVVYGNVRYVDPRGVTKRLWESRPYASGLFQKSWTPAHPTFYTYRSNYEKYGVYRTDFCIAADVELMYRFLEVHKLPAYYLPQELVVMSAGGVSNSGLDSTLTIYREVKKAIIENGGSFNDIEYLFYKLLKVKEFLWRR